MAFVAIREYRTVLSIFVWPGKARASPSTTAESSYRPMVPANATVSLSPTC
jgi:hypothetical protein